jgi:hypothetical protein
MPNARPQRLAVRLFRTLTLVLAAIVTTATGVDANEPASPAGSAARRLQKMVDAIREDLAIAHPVAVELVGHNPLKASVGPVKGSPGTFRLAIDRGFLDQLTEEELRAVVAHELGHVWIYTHHPYLQTEQLANKIALRVVSRESLEKVYGKVWAADAAGAGSLPRFPDAPKP